MAQINIGDDMYIDNMSRIMYDIPNIENATKRKKRVQVVQCPDIYSQRLEKETIRLIHISDTHLNHNDYFEYIPNGDILIHSGDFFNDLTLDRNNEIIERNLLNDFSNFFSKLPHKFKIFVAGNHESDLSQCKYNDICQLLSVNNKNIIYLQDNSVNLYGINIYGTPFNEEKHIKPSYCKYNERPLGFSINTESLINKWNDIPFDTDILITHQPPHHIMDYAKGYEWDKRLKLKESNNISNQLYLYENWGCPYLRDKILNDIKPLTHLFGHAHRSTGYLIKNDILFVNSAMSSNKIIHYFDVKKIKQKTNKQSKL